LLAVCPAAGQQVGQAAGQGGQAPAGAGAGATTAGPAQPLDTGTLAPDVGGSVTIPSPVLTIDPDRLFADSEYGKRVERELEDQARALAAQNRKIEAELSAEEKKLTEERPKLPPEQFRKLADAFDTKVQRIRKEQDAKNKALGTRREEERRKFLRLVLPILASLIRENGAVAILNRQAIFLSFNGIDITDRAIARINTRIGDGAALDKTAPDTKPAPGAATPPPAPAPAAPNAPASGN
jgi:Skp family chaperone for outer membrane proteins